MDPSDSSVEALKALVGSHVTGVLLHDGALLEHWLSDEAVPGADTYGVGSAHGVCWGHQPWPLPVVNLPSGQVAQSARSSLAWASVAYLPGVQNLQVVE